MEMKYTRKNMVLVVDDTKLNRKRLSEMLQGDYDVLEAKDGVEACEALEQHQDEIAIVLLDIIMPRMDGFEVLERMNQEHWIDHIPVIMITTENSDETINRASELGAIDYITKPFNIKIVRIRVDSTIRLYEKQRALLEELEQQRSQSKDINPMTGLLVHDAFFREAQTYLKKHPSRIAVIAVDIEHFKLVNESYGRHGGNDLLRELALEIRTCERDYDALGGYFYGDDFCMLLPYDEKKINEIEHIIVDSIQHSHPGSGILPVLGVYDLENRGEDLNSAYDKARMAMERNLGNYHSRLCMFTPEMLEQVKKDNFRIGQVMEGLQKEEFLFYIQPHCDTQTGKIVGGEALARWRHNDKIMPPVEFIPLMRKKAVIPELDLFVWEHVCLWQRQWIDAGHHSIPISINVSKPDIYSMDVPEIMNNLMTIFNLDPAWLVIEITEDTCVEDYAIVNEMVERLHGMGFRVWMDDFGSGASSLNMLSQVKVDALKLDMKFLESLSRDKQSVAILDTIIHMSKLLKLPLIAEGVETEQQLDYLKKRDCEVVQGYYFYKPMPVSDFEQLLTDNNNVLYDYSRVRKEFEKQSDTKIDISERLIMERVLENIYGLYLMDVRENLVVAMKTSDHLRRKIGFGPIQWDGEAANVFMDLFEKKDRPDVTDFLSRDHVRTMFTNGNAPGSRCFTLENGVVIQMGMYLLKMVRGETETALLIITDNTAVRDSLMESLGLSAAAIEKEPDPAS